MKTLEEVGYIASRPLELAFNFLASEAPYSGARTVLLEGPPGSGKTAFGEAVSRALGARFVYGLLHEWSGPEDLFNGVNVGAVVRGEGDVEEPGVLLQAARLSQSGRCVLLLDEVDKASPAVEALLLDWLQSGRVPVRPGVHEVARLDRVAVVITSNGYRPLSGALLRRCRRVVVPALPAEVEREILAKKTGAPVGLVKVLQRAGTGVAQAEGGPVSVQELGNALTELLDSAESLEDVRFILQAWLPKTQEGMFYLASPDGQEAIRRVWAEVAQARK